MKRACADRSDDAHRNAAHLIERRHQHVALGERRAALEFAERATSMQLASPAHQVAVGRLLVECNEVVRALALFEHATAAHTPALRMFSAGDYAILGTRLLAFDKRNLITLARRCEHARQ
jgi:hypothetical protein